MSDWITIPPLVDDQIVQANVFQDMWANLHTMKEKEVERLPTPSTNITIWTTTSTNFVPIDTTSYRATFESHGGDLILIAGLPLESASNRDIRVDFRLDGELLGNSLGLFYWTMFTASEVAQLIHYATGVPEGTHDLITEFSTSDVLYQARIYDRPGQGLWIVELP